MCRKNARFIYNKLCLDNKFQIISILESFFLFFFKTNYEKIKKKIRFKQSLFCVYTFV
jgi:hypothetical protein